MCNVLALVVFHTVPVVHTYKYINGSRKAIQCCIQSIVNRYVSSLIVYLLVQGTSHHF